jgi:hypothetical protein
MSDPVLVPVRAATGDDASGPRTFDMRHPDGTVETRAFGSLRAMRRNGGSLGSRGRVDLTLRNRRRAERRIERAVAAMRAAQKRVAS